MHFLLFTLLLAQPQPEGPSPEEVAQRLGQRMAEVSEGMEFDPQRAIDAYTAIIEDPDARRLEARSPAIAMYREQATYVRAALLLQRGETEAVIADMTEILGRKRARFATRVASLVGSVVPISAQPPQGIAIEMSPFSPAGAQFNLWDFQHALILRSRAYQEAGQTEKARADLAMHQEITREMLQGVFDEDGYPLYPDEPPELPPWLAVFRHRFFQNLPLLALDMVTSPWFVVGVFAFAVPYFYLSGRRQRRDGRGTRLRLLCVSLALAACLVTPLLAASLLLRTRPYLFFTSALGVVTLTTLIFLMFWLRTYVAAVTWEQTKVSPPLLEDRAVLDRIRELSDRMGIATPVARLIHSPSSQQLNQAMVCGLAAPTVVLFDGILHRLSEEERDAIIAHELAHLANHTFWWKLAAGTAVCVASVVAAAFYPALVVFGLMIALAIGSTLFLSRWFELDCDRRAARAIGHRRSASALFKIHADEPWRHSAVLEFLIGAIGTHPSRDERLAAIHRDAPPDARPDVEWDPRAVPRRRVAGWIAIALWLAVLAGSLYWGYRSPNSRLPAVPLFLLAAAPLVLLWLALRKGSRRQQRLRREGGRWLSRLSWVFYLLLAAYITLDYLDIPARHVSRGTHLIILLALLAAVGVTSLLGRRGGAARRLQQKFAVAFQSGDYAGALEVFESNPRVVAGNTLLRHDRALTLAILGRRQEAIRELEQLLRDDPSFKLTWLSLVSIYSDEENYERALELSAELTRDVPGDIVGPQSEAWVLRKLGRLDEAEAKAREVLRLDPNDGSIHLTLAGIALDRGDLDSARRHLAQAERALPGTVGVALLAAEIALASSDPNAEALVMAAVKAAKNTPLAFADREVAALAGRLEPLEVVCAAADQAGCQDVPPPSPDAPGSPPARAPELEKPEGGEVGEGSTPL